jgi:glycosyltransferase involved in cell wall biosynthesis
LTPSVSVVLPTRNRSSLLPTAIRSVLAQTFSDLELIVVDDASDDDTPRVTGGFTDPRVRILRRERPGGGAQARNDGIASATGELVAFLDDDDEWFPEKLESQTALLRSADPRVGVVYSSYSVVDRESGQVLGRKVARDRGDLSETLLARNVVGGTSSVVVRRQCLTEAGGFDAALPSFQDYDLWIRLSRNAWFDFVERDLLRYYEHGRKIWTNLDALERGIEIMAGKHGGSRAMRRNLSLQSLGLGEKHCGRGETARGRNAFRRAIRLDPIAVRPYLNMALSFLGSAVFRSAHELKAKISHPRRGAAHPQPGRNGPAESGVRVRAR